MIAKLLITSMLANSSYLGPIEDIPYARYDSRSYTEIMPGFEEDNQTWLICSEHEPRYRFDNYQAAMMYKNIELKLEDDDRFYVQQWDCDL